MIEPMTTADGVTFLRTPEASFAGLADFPHAPQFVDVEGLRLAYVDVGPREGPVALLMHGMPTWGFLNRRIIDALVAAGWRCIAADHIGFGRSDKPTDPAWYSIGRHTRAHRRLIETLDLKDITLFCQDWGGPIGLAQAAQMPERFDRLVIMNTWLHHAAYDYTPALRQWNAQWQEGGMFATNIPDPLSIGWFMMLSLGHMPREALFSIVQGAAPPALGPEGDAARRGYDAPFEGLGSDSLAGARRFPLSLPFYNPEGGAAEDQARHFETLLAWKKPVNFVWGGDDNIFTEDWGRAWAAMYPQATFDLIPATGHFLQDRHGEEIARIVLGHIAAGR